MAHMQQESDTGHGLGPAGLTLAFVAAALLIFSRCPSLLLHWQFYAEDGKTWFEQAYNGGWLHSLTIPDAGYLNTLQRLLTGPALLVPFRYAPLLQTAEGLLLQALPVPILLSTRCRTWGSLPARCLMAALYVAVPGSTEIHVVLTDSQWHYALLELLVAFAVPPRSWLSRTGDIVLFLLGGFCGPFGLLLLPLAVVFGWVKRQRWSFLVAGLLAVGSAVQVWELAHGLAKRSGELGANAADLARILGADIFDCGLLGQRGFASGPLSLNVAAAVALLALFAWGLWRAPLPLRLLVVFSALIVAGALHAPMISGPGTQWQLLTRVTGSRYWALPILTLLWCVAAMAFERTGPRALRSIAVALLMVSLVGIVHDWRVRPMDDTHFQMYATRFEEARPGQHVFIPIFPDGWTMDLLKKP